MILIILLGLLWCEEAADRVLPVAGSGWVAILVCLLVLTGIVGVLSPLLVAVGVAGTLAPLLVAVGVAGALAPLLVIVLIVVLLVVPWSASPLLIVVRVVVVVPWSASASSTSCAVMSFSISSSCGTGRWLEGIAIVAFCGWGLIGGVLEGLLVTVHVHDG